MNNIDVGREWSVLPTSEWDNKNLPFPQKWTFVLLISATYVAVLSFVFPGYFDPLYAIHSDVYVGPGLSTRNPSLISYFEWPRPIGYLTAHLIGLANVQVFILILIGVTIASTACTVKLVQHVIQRPIPVIVVVFYAALLFSHPQFYINYIHDTLGTLAYLYVVGGMLLWYRYTHKPSRRLMAFCVAVFGMAALTKETYFVTAVVFFFTQVFLCTGQVRKASFFLLSFVFAAEGGSLYWNLHSIEPFIRLDDEATAYALDFSIFSMVDVLWFYGQSLLSPVLLIPMSIGCYAVFRERKSSLAIAALTFSGFCALLPHIPLANHVSAQYAWTALPLALVPILLISDSLLFERQSRWGLAIVACCLLFLVVISHEAEYRKNDWAIQQERVNRNITKIFPRWKNLEKHETEILITGLLSPLHPFNDHHYVTREFGLDRTWTVLVARDVSQSYEQPVKLVEPGAILFTNFDRIFSFNSEGQLVNEWSSEEIKSLKPTKDSEITEMDVILFPALRKIREHLIVDPDAWYKQQEAAVIFWNWGLTHRAELMLNRALQNGGSENPYPYYYLGQINEWRGDTKEAQNYYQMAVEREHLSPNTVFKQALEGIASSTE